MKILKELLNIITHRLFIVVFILLIQIILLILFVTKFENYILYFYFLADVIGLLLLLKIINSSSNPSYKIAWIIPILTIPIFGTLFYLILGNNYNKGKNKRFKEITSKFQNNLKQDPSVVKEIQQDNLDAYNQINYLIRNCNLPVYKNTEVEYLETGEKYFDVLIRELEKAKNYIFLEFFIIQEGKMWNTILDILVRKASMGVDVRLIYDDMGCIVTLPNRYHKRLEKYGIKACPFNKFVPVLTAKLNNRDHRKIVVIDGVVGFTGGVNLADEYINEVERFGYWKDNAVMLRGEAVWSLTVMFLSIWNYIKHERDDYDKFRQVEFKGIKSSGYVQPYDDSPLDNEIVGETVYLNLINKAKKYVYITTPYLIIDNELEMALKIVAKNGIDVKIVVPSIADKKTVNEVTKAYYYNLLLSGIGIYEYTPGFIHAKTVIVDDLYATVGTVNLDYRSLYLHFECGVLMYKTKCIKDIKDDFNNILNKSKEVTLNDTKIGLFRGLKRAILKLFAPLM